MNGKIILNLAISLDRYIADESGGFDWIVRDGLADNFIKANIIDEYIIGIIPTILGK